MENSNTEIQITDSMIVGFNESMSKGTSHWTMDYNGDLIPNNLGIKKNNLIPKLNYEGKEPDKDDDKDAAALCQWAYDYYDDQLHSSNGSYNGWQIVERPEEFLGKSFKLNVKSTGFSSLLFKKEKNGIIYYAYCTVGTKMTSWEDWVLGNIAQGLIGLSPQYTRSVQNAKILNDYCKGKAVLWFIGHSLGGGLASNNSLITGRYAITFDAAGLNVLRVKMSMIMNIFYKNRQKYFFNYHGRTSKIHAYILRGEVVNRVLQFIAQKAYGKRTIFNAQDDSIKNKNTFDKHALTNIIKEWNIPYRYNANAGDFMQYEQIKQC